MTKIERRRAVVTLYHGNYEAEMADLWARAVAAARDEASGVAPKRSNTRSKATALGKEHDALRAEADETAEKVTVWAIGHDDWDELADEHTPRENEARDAEFGLNMKTFPRVLLCASLPEPHDPDIETLEERLKAGRELLAALDLSRVNYRKLEQAAWAINVGDDALPKSSLVSLLKQVSEPDSPPPSDSE